MAYKKYKTNKNKKAKTEKEAIKHLNEDKQDILWYKQQMFGSNAVAACALRDTDVE